MATIRTFSDEDLEAAGQVAQDFGFDSAFQDYRDCAGIVTAYDAYWLWFRAGIIVGTNAAMDKMRPGLEEIVDTLKRVQMKEG